MPSDQGPEVSALFRFQSLAVVGASARNRVALSILRSLDAIGYGGRVACIHPSAEPVLGRAGYPSLGAVPHPLDAAVLAIGRERVPGALEECAAAGIRAVTVISGGFAEAGATGQALERRIADTARRSGIALCGPNCLGCLSVSERTSMYARADLPSRAGTVAVVSHSGGLLNEILAYGDYRGVAFSHAVSAGNEAVLSVADYLEFLLRDGRTEAIGLVIEGVRAPARLRAALAAAAAAGKPVVALKIGTSAQGSRAAITHTGALVGSAEIFAALCRQYGVTVVPDVDTLCEQLLLFSHATTLLRGDRPPGGAAVIEISGGGKGLVCDLADRYGVALPALGGTCERRVAAVLPAGAVADNPLDIGSSWDVPGSLDVHRGCLAALGKAPGLDVILSRITVSPAGDIAGVLAHGEAVAAAQRAYPERLFAVLGRSSDRIHEGWRNFCLASGVSYLQGYGRGLAAVGALLAYRRFLAGRAFPPAEKAPTVTAGAGGSVGGSPNRENGAANCEDVVVILDAVAAKELLAAAGLPVNPTRFAADTEEAAAAAREIGFPVVLKGISLRAVHKSDFGLVALPLTDAAAVRAAAGQLLARLAALEGPGPRGRVGLSVEALLPPGAEVIIGGYRDMAFGPVILCGIGGTWTEVLADRALRLAPFGMRDAAEMIMETRIPKVAPGFRGLPPFDVTALARLLAAAGEWLVGRSDVEEFDLNPVICRGSSLTIADARIVLRPPAPPPEGGPGARPAR